MSRDIGSRRGYDLVIQKIQKIQKIPQKDPTEVGEHSEFKGPVGSTLHAT